MSKLGDPVDLSHQLNESKLRNRVSAVGIELEGGWREQPAGVTIGHDGSVIGMPSQARYVGELASPPILTTQIETWMTKCYPDYVNETCGLHVHMSFDNAFLYQRLMDDRYPATILRYIERWAKDEKLSTASPIWDRLAGRSVYCQHVFAPDEQAQAVKKDFSRTRPGNRYTVINYPFSRTHTIECRLLPMMPTTVQGIRAVQEVIHITNAFLVKTAARERKYVKVVQDDGDSTTYRSRAVL